MTSKIHLHDCKGHITCNFFHCPALTVWYISPIAKVMGLQSCERKGSFYFLTPDEEHHFRHRKSIQHDCSDNIRDITHYFYYWTHEALNNTWKVLAKISWLVCPLIIFSMGRPQKPTYFCQYTKSFMRPIIKVMSDITNIITAVMLNAFSMPEMMFFVRS